MTIAIAKAYNGIHRDFNKYLKTLGVQTFYFNIDSPDWFKIESKQPRAYLWLADQKEERYREIHDKIYYIQNILKKSVFPDMAMYFAEGDKVKQWQILKHLKAPTLKTHIAQHKHQALRIVKKIEYPFVLKDPYGYGGQHVFKINNQSQALKYINKIFGSGLKTNYSTCQNIFYAQEFITSRKDLRVVTIGPKVFCAYWRIGQPGRWKHNLDQGAQVSFENIPSQALKLCQKISKIMQFHWMGYDLLIKDGDAKIIEYSCCVRTQGARQGGFDVRRVQMEYLVKKLS